MFFSYTHQLRHCDRNCGGMPYFGSCFDRAGEVKWLAEPGAPKSLDGNTVRVQAGREPRRNRKGRLNRCREVEDACGIEAAVRSKNEE